MDFITMQLIIKTMNSCESSLGPRRTLHNRRLIKGNIVDHMLLVTLVALIAQLSLAFTDAALPGSHSVLKRSREKCSTKPNLQLVTPKLVLRKANVHYNESLGEIFAPANNTKLSVECTSSSPIDFDFQGYLVNNLLSVETSRIPHDNGRDECYKITVEFLTKREATGNYVCWNIGNSADRDSLFVYADGISPPFLLHGHINDDEIKVKVTPDQTEVIIPCATTNPSVPVALYKSERHTFRLLYPGHEIEFDSTVGFRLTDVQVRSPLFGFGQYKCIDRNSSDSHVIVEVKEAKEILAKNGTSSDVDIFSYSNSNSAFLCTSDSEITFKSTRNCDNTIDCRLTERCMRQETLCGHSMCDCLILGKSCSKKTVLSHVASNQKKNQCNIVSANHIGGLVQCESNSVSSLPYFIGLNGSIVHSWQSANTSNLLQTSLTDYPNVEFFFVGEDVKFSCIGVKFIFSEGSRWKFLLKNGTYISVNVSSEKSQTTRHDGRINTTVTLKLFDPSIEYVVCNAPVWNETTWVESRLRINLRDTVAPRFLEPENITLVFYETQKNASIRCEAEGSPAPDILWFKGKEEVIDKMAITANDPNVTSSVLHFPEISELDHEIVYTCNASNPRGMVFKTYTIYVKAHPSKLIFTLVGVGMVVCFGIVLVVSIMMLKKMQKNKSSYIFHFNNDFDMEEFKKGNPEAVNKSTDASERALHMPYDMSYEIDEAALTIDYESILGQGEFGVVIKGKITKQDMTLPVAVKTLRTTEISSLKAILSELKILMFIGKHRNVIQLIGAVTKKIHERKVYVVVEYCALGNLESYLKQHRGSFLDEFDPTGNSLPHGATSPGYVRIDYLLKSTDLIKWSYDVATGMEFLASKKIIHGDLAIRNLLLDGEQNVKITDFGLSKQMYKYMNNYIVKRKDTPLPWRWLAIETLQDYDFSTPSDVWSFGVVLFELFSLAETPYVGYNFNSEFLRLLLNGFRLDKPRYANAEIYSIMRECWRSEPSQRPTFTYLRQVLARMLPPGSIELGEDPEVIFQNDKNQLRDDYFFGGNESQSLTV